MGNHSPVAKTKMLYSYEHSPFQRHRQSLGLPPMSRLSPTQHTWAVPQTHREYYAMSRHPPTTSTEEAEQRETTSIDASYAAPAMNNSAVRTSVDGADPLAADYFPAVVDSSTPLSNSNSVDNTTLSLKDPWNQKACEDFDAFPSPDMDMGDFHHSIIGQEEGMPIIDLRQYVNMANQDPTKMSTYDGHAMRRMSGSSFSMSSTSGVPPETTSYEELGHSDVIPCTQDYEVWSHLEPSSKQRLSPFTSPRRLPYEGMDGGGSSRNCRSPGSHNNVGSSPYARDGSSGYYRWSTGQAPTSTPISSCDIMQPSDCCTPFSQDLNPHYSMPPYSPIAFSNMYSPLQTNMLSSRAPAPYDDNQLRDPLDHAFQLEVPRPEGFFGLLGSSADQNGGCSSHFAGLSDPPDLYSSLQQEASNPPESDMKPADPDLVPHEQDLRFLGDLYTPRWIRGHGNKREGWCGLCKPGRWLVLKNSAFWYDKSFTHGVSAATGTAFQGPQDTRRTDSNLDVWEGLCGSCGEWVALVSSKKKGTTWFRHAYKCHTHPKVKDGLKRRRQTQVGRVCTGPPTLATPSYPMKPAISPRPAAVSHQHATPIAMTGNSGSWQSFGMPDILPSTPLPAASTASYPNHTCYPSPASATAANHHSLCAGTSTAISMSGASFCSPQLAHSGSQPEVVGVCTTSSAPLPSIASRR